MAPAEQLRVAAGAKRKRADRLKAAGVTDEQLARINAPIGIDIGSRTPEEVAIAGVDTFHKARKQEPVPASGSRTHSML